MLGARADRGPREIGGDVPPASRRPVAPSDALWLNMDRPNNLMVIVSLVFLESVPDWERVAEILRERVVARYPVFRQRPVEPLLPSCRRCGRTTTSRSSGTCTG